MSVDYSGAASLAPRRRLQFGLATALMATALCAVAFAVGVAPVYRIRRGQARAAALESAGADLYYRDPFEAGGTFLSEPSRPDLTTLESWLGEDRFRRLAWVALHDAPGGADRLLLRIDQHLAAIDHPFGLGFGEVSLEEASLDRIAGLGQLTRLDLGEATIEDGDLRPVAMMKNLRELTLPATTGDVGLAHLKGLTHLTRLSRRRPALSSLASGDMSADDFEQIREGQWLTDAGVAHLEVLVELQTLDLSFARVTNDGLASLAQLTNLKSLDLSHTEISDAGLARLKSLKRLQTLDLSDTRVLGPGLIELATLPELRSLDLACCRLSHDLGEIRRRRGEAAYQAEQRAAVNDAVALLMELRQLENLSLNRIDLYDESCECLTELPKLKMIDLSGISITCSGLELLRSAPSLRELWLAHTPLGDNAVKTLKRFPALRKLHVGGTNINCSRFGGSRIVADVDFWPGDFPREW